MTPRRVLTLSLIGGLLLTMGCRHRCHKRNDCSVPSPMIGSPAPFRGGSGNGGLLPPTSINPVPLNSGGSINEKRTPEILLPTGPSTSNSSPRGTGVIVYPPTPEVTEKVTPEANIKPAPKSSNPPSAELFPTPPREASNPLPTGIADFARVKDNLYSGLKPNLDGLTWLKKNDFKSVLRLRRPTDADEADKLLVEQQGLKYVSLEISPETLTQDLIDRFNQLVLNPDHLPSLVYDRDGTLAGVMWYLHFRTVELLKDDEAILRAKKHGLRENGSTEAKELWLAVQKYLSDR